MTVRPKPVALGGQSGGGASIPSPPGPLFRANVLYVHKGRFADIEKTLTRFRAE